MAERFLLDTSAILTHTDQEDGAAVVEDLLAQGAAGRIGLEVASISLTELYYIALRAAGEDGAARLLALVRSWPLDWIPADERVLLQAGLLKAFNRLSLADALIAATAKLRSSVLVHKDPELALLSGELELLELPPKK